MATLLSDDELCSRVRSLLYGNLSEGYSWLLRANYCYIKPSPKKYPFQWFWDTCFHIFILCALGETDLAKRNLESLFLMQEDDGFVGHMIFWKRLLPTSRADVMQARPTLAQLRRHTSALIQPPFAAQALLRIYEETHDEEFLRRMLPRVRRFLDWLSRERDFDGDGLLTIISPFESGLDYKPSFDAALGFRPGPPDGRLYAKAAWIDFHNFIRHYKLDKIHRAGKFLVKEVMMNTAYALDLTALARLSAIAGRPDDALRYERQALTVTERMRAIMYDEADAAFYDVTTGANAKLRSRAFTIFLPTILPAMPKKLLHEALKRHLRDPVGFAVPYPIPTVARSDPSFFLEDTWYLWRGPTWALGNWLLLQCLLRCDLRDVAEELLLSLRRLIAKSGFREYYHPFTGDGMGEKDFTWSGLVVDMMRMMEKPYP